MLRLIGVLIVIIGFAFKLDSILIIVIAAIVTALCGGLGAGEFLETLGSSFVANRSTNTFIIMGNAFAAITVLTVGIGAPFVLAYGADPVLICSVAMTCGYCGTLMTPMAANFNIVPAAILEIKDRNGVIKKQVLMGLIMLAFQLGYMILFKQIKPPFPRLWGRFFCSAPFCEPARITVDCRGALRWPVSLCFP